MSYKEKNSNPNFKLQNNNLNGRMKIYAQNILIWRDYTLDLLNHPDNTPTDDEKNEMFVSFSKHSAGEKSRKMSFILNHEKVTRTMDAIYMAARIILHEKYKFYGTNCVSCATFISTFSQWMDPNNQTELLFGKAIIYKSPNKEEIGEQSDHFWVKINSRAFDNSHVDDCSYTNPIPILRFNILSNDKIEIVRYKNKM